MNKLCWVFLLLLATGSCPLWADAHYDIVLVGRGTTTPTLRAIRQRLEQMRANQGLTSLDLPIDQYDVGNPGHRAALARVHIPVEQLPYLGVCQLGGAGNRPVKLLYGAGPVSDIDAATTGILAFALKHVPGTAVASQPVDTIPTTTAVDVTPIQSPDEHRGVDPAAACKNFYLLVWNRQYPEAWTTLSSHSKLLIVQAEAQEMHRPVAQVQSQFDADDPVMLNRLFEQLRNNINSAVAERRFFTVQQDEQRATVTSDKAIQNGKAASLVMVHEDGSWKVGLVESLEAQKKAAGGSGY